MRRSEVEPSVKARKALSRGRRRSTVRHGRKAAMKGGTRLVLGKTQAKPHRHVASPATVREIARSLGLTAKDLAAGSSLVDRLMGPRRSSRSSSKNRRCAWCLSSQRGSGCAGE